MNRSIEDIKNLLDSPTLTVYEKIIVVEVNQNNIPDINTVIEALKVDDEYITSPVKHVFDRIINNIISNQQTAVA